MPQQAFSAPIVRVEVEGAYDSIGAHIAATKLQEDVKGLIGKKTLVLNETVIK
jgi:hypothetical protein